MGRRATALQPPTRLAAAIVERRGRAHQAEVAAQLGVRDTALSRLERGLNIPAPETAIALATWLGWPLEEVYKAAKERLALPEVVQPPKADPPRPSASATLIWPTGSDPDARLLLRGVELASLPTRILPAEDGDPEISIVDAGEIGWQHSVEDDVIILSEDLGAGKAAIRESAIGLAELLGCTLEEEGVAHEKFGYRAHEDIKF